MSSAKKLGDLRKWINSEFNQQHASGIVSNDEILKRVKGEHADEIAALIDPLINIALIKLLNDVSSRKGTRTVGQSGFDLFGQYHGIPQWFSVGRGLKKQASKMTIGEIDAVLARRLKAENSKNKELSRLLNDCRNAGASDEETLEDVATRLQKTQK